MIDRGRTNDVAEDDYAVRETLVALALWMHPVWDIANEDDVREARRAVLAFLQEYAA